MRSSDLTPTEELIMEVLAARTRLGHDLWTFDANGSSTKASRSLEERGLLVLLHGITERSFRAMLTDAGKEMYLSGGYTPPILGGPK